MKNILNIIGYVLFLGTPYIGLIFIFIWLFPVKMIFLIILIFMIILQIIHFRKTKIKMMGIRILITILVTLIITVISHISYGNIKNIEAQKILNNIEKIEVHGYILEKEKLKIQFVNQALNITKFTNTANVYYNNGNIESIKVSYSTPAYFKDGLKYEDLNLYIYEINGNKYYLKIND